MKCEKETGKVIQAPIKLLKRISLGIYSLKQYIDMAHRPVLWTSDNKTPVQKLNDYKYACDVAIEVFFLLRASGVAYGPKKIGKPINNYREYLVRVIVAAENAVKATGHEHHKGALKAYKNALKKLDKYSISLKSEPIEDYSKSPG